MKYVNSASGHMADAEDFKYGTYVPQKDMALYTTYTHIQTSVGFICLCRKRTM